MDTFHRELQTGHKAASLEEIPATLQSVTVCGASDSQKSMINWPICCIMRRYQDVSEDISNWKQDSQSIKTLFSLRSTIITMPDLR